MSIESTVTGIGQIAINVRDLPRAIAFYRDVVGLKFLFEAPPKMAFFDCGGVRLLVGEPEAPEHNHPSSILYFRVADIHGAARGLAERGAEIVSPPHLVAKLPDRELWLAFFKDGEGNTMALMFEG